MRYLIALLLLLSACRTPGAFLASPLVGEVKAALSSTQIEVPRFVFRNEPTMSNGARAVCYENYIVIMGEGQEALDYYIAHESVHWYIDDSPYAGLPHFIEEGLADWIACGLLGLREARIEENARIGTMAIDPRHMGVGIDGWTHLPLEIRRSHARAGFDLVNRLGLAKLRALAGAGADPLGYLHAAGILETR